MDVTDNSSSGHTASIESYRTFLDGYRKIFLALGIVSLIAGAVSGALFGADTISLFTFSLIILITIGLNATLFTAGYVENKRNK